MSGNAYTTACKLLTLGYSVIPSGGGDRGKAPTVTWQNWQKTPPDANQLEDWETTLHPTLWGIVTNDRIAVIDADTPETKAALEAEIGEPHVATPRGGAHWYIDTAGHPMKTIAGLLPGVDVRGVGGFVNIAGGKYRIVRLPVPNDTLIPYDKLPKRILAALNGSKPASATPTDSAAIPEGVRHAALVSFAGSLRARGLKPDVIYPMLKTFYDSRCEQNPPVPDSELRSIADSMENYAPGRAITTDQPAHFNLTDAGNAEHFTVLYGDRLRYDHRRDRWLEWQKHHWQPRMMGKLCDWH